MAFTHKIDKTVMETGYILEWFDQMVFRTLNPLVQTDFKLKESELQAILKKANQEEFSQSVLIRQTVCGINKQYSLQFFITRYYTSIIHLLDQANENLRYADSDLFKAANQHIISSLNNLIFLIYERYANYLSLDERCPCQYVEKEKKEWQKKIPVLKNKYDSEAATLQMLVFDEIDSYINSGSIQIVTIRTVLYFSELLREIENLTDKRKINQIFTPLEQMLIFLNFNSKANFDYLTHKMAAIANHFESLQGKLDQLLMMSKEINQLLVKPQISLQPGNDPIKSVLANWLGQEIIYLEKRLHLSVVPYQLREDTVAIKRSKSDRSDSTKVLCMLSVDQMAIVLRAADEMKLIMARSISAVYNQITPYLSSPYKEEISADSMRSKSYSAEERDKEIVIQTLKKMIEKIDEF